MTIENADIVTRQTNIVFPCVGAGKGRHATIKVKKEGENLALECDGLPANLLRLIELDPCNSPTVEDVDGCILRNRREFTTRDLTR